MHAWPRFLRLLPLGAMAVLCAACGGGGEDGGPVAEPGYVGGPGDRDSATVIVDGRPVLLWRGTEAGVERIEHQRQSRPYLVIRPQGPASEAPALVFLHGNAGTPQGMASQVGAAALVATRQVVAVLPEALDQRWSEDPADPRGIDDVGLLTALALQLQATPGIDDRRLYLAGFSNGGAMVQRYACANPAGFAAYGVVSAVLRPVIAANCASSPARPIAYILGTLDPIVAFEGIAGLSSARSSVDHWVQAQGCGREVRESLPNSALDGTTTDLFRYPACTGGHEIRFYRVNAGGHAWPGSDFEDLNSNLGLTARDFSATEAFHFYFSTYRR